MTIYGVGYRSLEYGVEPRRKRWWPVAMQEFRSLFRNRWGVFLFLLLLTPSLMGLGILLLQMGVIRIGDAEFEFGMAMDRVNPDWRETLFNAANVRFFTEPVYRWGFLPFLAVTCLVSSRSIAKDRQTNALEVYWTRGITPVDYFVAKWLGTAMLVGALFVAAPAVLWVLGVFLADDLSYLRETAGFIPVALLSNAFFALVLTYLATTFSAMTRSPNLAAILWLFLIVGSQAFANMLARILNDRDWLALSVWEAMGSVVRWACGIGPATFGDFNRPGLAGAMVLVYALVLTALMCQRLRLREAVG